MKWIMLGLAGGLGCMLRAWVGERCSRYGGHSTELWSILLCNCLGCFLAGVMLAMADRLGAQWLWVLATGFLGGLTTFSAFSSVTCQRLAQGDVLLALGYVVLTVVLCLLATGLAWLGMRNAFSW